ncbi:MAG: Hsp33 family molecular chaperone HslO [Desulfuromonadales bacterium]|nr:Hsp33 family molecular chaperone HslO [Desulfuromonadales bacterium]MDT8423297.1 Hsp33 family molecular chaperone HslO [Desulfuromonadales bacterium]
MSDHLLRLLTNDGYLRAAAAQTTDLCEKLRSGHRTDPTATVAVSQLATAAALCSSLLKGRQRLGLLIEANGPLGKLHAETDAAGNLRATVKNPTPGLPPKNERFDVAGAIGHAGFLHVIKDLGMKEPYRGMVQLMTSEIAQDLAYYFATSEQTPSSVVLGAQLAGNGAVAAAGGLLIQVLPGCPEGHLVQLEQRLAVAPPFTEQLRSGKTPDVILGELFNFIPHTLHGETPLNLRCNCSRGYTLNLLGSLSSEELTELTQDGGIATVTCEYCRKEYRFNREDITQLMAQSH